MSSARCALVELAREFFGRHRQELLERRERAWDWPSGSRKRPNIPGASAPSAASARNRSTYGPAVMRHDLREIELRVDALLQQVFHLRRRRRHVGLPTRPSARSGHASPDLARATARHARRSAPARRSCLRRERPALRIRDHERDPRTPGSSRVDACRSEMERRSKRGTSLPRLMTRCRRLSSSFDPTALSVRNTNVPRRVRLRTA